MLEPKDELIRKKREKERVDQDEANGEGPVWKEYKVMLSRSP